MFLIMRRKKPTGINRNTLEAITELDFVRCFGCFSIIFVSVLFSINQEQKPIVFVTLWVECEYLDWHKTCDRWPLIISQIIVYVRRILRTLEYKIVENTDVFCCFDLNEFFLRKFLFALIGESSKLYIRISLAPKIQFQLESSPVNTYLFGNFENHFWIKIEYFSWKKKTKIIWEIIKTAKN